MSNVALAAMVATIIADGKIDDSEVAQLRAEVYQDGKVEADEVENLFKINDACSDNADNSKEWPVLLADAVCDCVLKDEATPGVVSKEESEWLANLLMADGSVDDTEKFVLTQLKSRATSLDSDFATQLAAIGL